jgi:Flp pilus assembly protein TadD
MQINRYNVQALGLLMKDRAPEADIVLHKALALDPRNPFTLNNLGYTKEKEGELEEALTFYSKAANVNSKDPIIVSMDKGWRGKGISEIASDNVRKLQQLMAKSETPESRVARLNLEGVSAMNRNDRAAARKYFQEAYRIAPDNAFTLNNMGFLAEMDGDRETAGFYYTKAADARGRSQRATVTTRRDLEGRPVGQVAEFGDTQVSARMEQLREARMREGGPIALRRRDNSTVVEPAQPPAPLPSEPIAVHDEYHAPAQPAASQPGAIAEPAGNQPAAAQPNQRVTTETTQPTEPVAQPRPKPSPELGPLPGSTEPLPPK